MNRYAAIDIGSNAIRLLIVGLIPNRSKQYRKISLIRVPIRLGQDVFIYNKISKTKAKDLLKTLKSFKLLMSVNKVDKYKICATSAMRESSNSKKIINTIYEKLGLKINVIPGKEESAIIANVFAKDFNNYNNFIIGSFQVNNLPVNMIASFNERKFGANGFYASPEAIDQYEETQASLLGASTEIRNESLVIKPKIYWKRYQVMFVFFRLDPSVNRYLHITNKICFDLIGANRRGDFVLISYCYFDLASFSFSFSFLKSNSIQ